MIYTLKNSSLTVLVSSLGGELQSIRTQDGIEYLWQGDPKSWNRHAPHLFPYIGRLTNGQFFYQGQSYKLKQHGFLRDNELTLEKHTDTELILSFSDDVETRTRYPFSFHFTLTYRLQGNKLTTIYQVENKTDDVMYFGLGGHPGFHVPIDTDLTFEDFYLAFEDGISPKQTLLSENYFISDRVIPYVLDKNNCIPLKHDLFDHDAIILSDAGNTVSICSDKSKHSILFNFSGFDYLGLWQAPKTDAKFICIEPWTSLPANDGKDIYLDKQENLVALPSGETCKKEWSIEMK